MAGFEDQKEQVQQATDIVRLVSDHVALKPKGREYAGLCPFHDDRSPSMMVSPAKQIFKCFACGAGGDVFSFVMKYHNLEFVDALKYLAEKAGIEIKRRDGGGGGGQGKGQRQRLRDANEFGMKWFSRQLKDDKVGQPARNYLDRRGVSDEMVKHFALGYAPQGWDNLTNLLTQRRLPLGDFEAAGLIASRRQGPGHYDKFRHRLIFPIHDDLGRAIAFGARRLDEEDEPKYLNSAETPLFNKSATLYGLHQAKRSILTSRTVVIVEGYTDVIACHQAGVTNVVAALGTAFTSQHAEKLRSLCDRVVLIFDADVAGQKAADRAVEIFFTESLDVGVAVLPDGKDPDELLKDEGGADRWKEAVEDAKDALGYLLSRMRQDVGEETTVTGHQRVAEQYIAKLVELGLGTISLGTIRQAKVYQQIAQMLHLSESAVRELVKKAMSNRPRRREPRGEQAAKPSLARQTPNRGFQAPRDQAPRGDKTSPSPSASSPTPPPPAKPLAKPAPPAGKSSLPDLGPDGQPIIEEEPDDFVPTEADLAALNGLAGDPDDLPPDPADAPDMADAGPPLDDSQDEPVIAAIGPRSAERHRLTSAQQNAQKQAELEFVGLLLSQPSLFSHVLPDGRSIEESVTPQDCYSEEGAEVFERMWQAWAAESPLEIGPLLAALAAESKLQLVEFATHAAMSVEQQMDDAEHETTIATLEGCVYVLAGQQDPHYHELRQRAISGDSVGDILQRRWQEKLNDPMGQRPRIMKPER